MRAAAVPTMVWVRTPALFALDLALHADQRSQGEGGEELDDLTHAPVPGPPKNGGSANQRCMPNKLTTDDFSARREVHISEAYSLGENACLYLPLPTPTSPFVRIGWPPERKLLAREREVTHLRDAVNAERRRLPMVMVEKDYVFEGPTGEVRLREMFEGRAQLYIHHFMWIDAIDEGCPSCTARPRI